MLNDRQRDKEAGSIAALRINEIDGIFHAQGGTEDDKMPDGKIYIEIGEDAPGECERCFDEAIAQAVREGLSDKGAVALRLLLEKHRSVFG